MLLNKTKELKVKLGRDERILGLDVGEKTIGMALSDASRQIASPLDTIERDKFKKDLEALKQVIAAHNIKALVIGYPINMDGTEGPRCQSIRQFAKNIDEALGIPMMLWDERMSTLAVERMMLDADLSRQRRDELVDKVAASYILQGVLDYLNQGA